MYNANVIADNIVAHCDDEGRRHAVWHEITDHTRDWTSVDIANRYVLTKNGRRIPKTTTEGWKLLCQWKDSSSGWIDLKHLKDSSPIELAEYAVANWIQEEPAFKCWVSETLQTQNRIIGKVKKRYWKTSHKFGFGPPDFFQGALQIDNETGTDFWWQAIQYEMKKVVIYSLTPEQVRLEEMLYVDMQEIACHDMIFDVKMDLTQKARFVAGGHLTDTPATITYSSVASRDEP